MRTSRFISWGHSFVYRRFPWLFKLGYRYFEKHPSHSRSNSTWSRFMARGSQRLSRYICENGFDCVICPHVFTSLMLTETLKIHPTALKTAFVSTDYTCSPGTKDTNLSYYFIPDTEFASDFECANIPESKMVPSGIPVRQMFYASCDKEDAKKQATVPPANKHLMVMCGSMGCGPLKNLLHKLSQKAPADWDISVICGNNTALKNRLAKQYADTPRIHVLGYITDIGTTMDSADLYLTKPGGISVSEAAVKHLPMVFVETVAGCEEYNRIHFVRNGGARMGANINELTEVCLSLMKNDEKRETMRAKLSRINKRNSAQIIYDTLHRQP